jgi:hypothetical protein
MVQQVIGFVGVLCLAVAPGRTMLFALRAMMLIFALGLC